MNFALAVRLQLADSSGSASLTYISVGEEAA